MQGRIPSLRSVPTRFLVVRCSINSMPSATLCGNCSCLLNSRARAGILHRVCRPARDAKTTQCGAVRGRVAAKRADAGIYPLSPAVTSHACSGHPWNSLASYSLLCRQCRHQDLETCAAGVRRNASQSDQTARSFLLTGSDNPPQGSCGEGGVTSEGRAFMLLRVFIARRNVSGEWRMADADSGATI